MAHNYANHRMLPEWLRTQHTLHIDNTQPKTASWRASAVGSKCSAGRGEDTSAKGKQMASTAWARASITWGTVQATAPMAQTQGCGRSEWGLGCFISDKAARAGRCCFSEISLRTNRFKQ